MSRTSRSAWAVRGAVVALAAAAAASLAAVLTWPVAAGAAVGASLGVATVWLERRAATVPIDRLFWGAVGGVSGLAIGLATGAAISSVVIGAGIFGAGLFALLGAYLGAALALGRQPELARISGTLFPGAGRSRVDAHLLDTSVIVDGRIVELRASGFLDGPLLVPRFVLGELQQLADSGDPVRRARGRRGFDVLETLRRDTRAGLEVVDRDVPGVADVDGKLVELSRAVGARLVTADTALARLAALRGATVLDLAALAAALRPAAVPGEVLTVPLVREGREPGQGIGYLGDGTMVVVEQARRHVGQTVEVSVTGVLPTSAGRMIFGRLREDQGAHAD
jgi:uncharacterized protein YacL